MKEKLKGNQSLQVSIPCPSLHLIRWWFGEYNSVSITYTCKNFDEYFNFGLQKGKNKSLRHNPSLR